jgi:hypothetical protein
MIPLCKIRDGVKGKAAHSGGYLRPALSSERVMLKRTLALFAWCSQCLFRSTDRSFVWWHASAAAARRRYAFRPSEDRL